MFPKEYATRWLRGLGVAVAWIDQPQDETTLGPDDVPVADGCTCGCDAGGGSC